MHQARPAHHPTGIRRAPAKAQVRATDTEAPTPPDRAQTMRTYIASFGSATAAAVIGARLLKLPVIRALPLPAVLVGAVVLGLGVGWIEGYEAMKRKTAEYQHAVDAQLNEHAAEFPRVGTSS